MKGKFAFVTGTSTGIGLATARALLKNGWIVFGTARRDCPIKNKNYKHVNADLSDITSFKPALTVLLRDQFDLYKRIVLINNAAVAGNLVTMDNYEPEELQNIITINYIVPVWLMGFFVSRINQETELQIVNISSGAARKAFPGMAGYCSTKAALKMAGETLAAELKIKSSNENPRISILSYEPGVVETNMQVQARSASLEDFPAGKMFRSFKEAEMLASPGVVALELVEFIEKGFESVFTEKRFGE